MKDDLILSHQKVLLDQNFSKYYKMKMFFMNLIQLFPFLDKKMPNFLRLIS